MSITFWMPQAPVERVVPYPDEPDYHEIRCVPPFVEINMTAGNANAILALIDPVSVNYQEDPYGEWHQDGLARVRRACIAALNSRTKAAALSPSREWVGAGGCHVITCGRSEDYIERLLNNFLELTKVAMEHGFTVTFG